jgi:plastocyanin
MVLALIVACSGDNGEGEKTANPASKPDTVAATPVNGALTIVATDNKFDRTSISIKANEQVSLTLDNKGSAIHNLHVLNVQSATGGDIETKLLPAGQQQTITFAIAKPGSYRIVCDVHPAEMKGQLTVQ